MLLSLLYMSEKKCTFAAANLVRNSEKQTEDIDTKKEPLRTLRRDDKIRTCDLRSPRPLRYRTAPHPDALENNFPQKRLQRYDFFLIQPNKFEKFL